MSDLIDRQAAIDAVHRAIFDFFDICSDDDESPITYKDEQLLKINKAITTQIRKLPSAQPERKRGKWIDEGFYADGHGAHAFRCSECGGYIIEYAADPFCKWCGADMRGKDDA